MRAVRYARGEIEVYEMAAGALFIERHFSRRRVIAAMSCFSCYCWSPMMLLMSRVTIRCCYCYSGLMPMLASAYIDAAMPR